MPTRNIKELKKLIYTRLTGDATLIGLLGGTTKIRHANPLQKAKYPCVVYSLINEEDDPYELDISAGVSKSMFQIEVFNTTTSVISVDDIDTAIYALFHGETFGNTKAKVKTCYRKQRVQISESETKVIRVYSIYEIVNTTIS